ncbi:MAG: hypothetical protein PHT59_06480 [Candidatus Omnitrophica bacterium]|nr:hypothetical protein [Candidatus Omnitrophota bacterium]
MNDAMTMRLDNLEPVLNNLRSLKKRMLTGLRDVFNANVLRLQTYLKQDLMSGTSDSTVASRSMQLKRNIVPIPFTLTEAFGMRTGLHFRTRYAKVHIGPEGQTMTMRSNRPGGWLAIPLPAAQGAHGQARGRPRDESLWGGTFIKRNENGNLIIYGYKGGQARSAGKVREILPLFILRKSVTVKTRIHPKQLLEWIEPKLVDDVKKEAALWPQR